MSSAPVRFCPMAGKVAVVAIHGPMWVQHEFTCDEALVLAGELGQAIMDAEARKGDPTWDLKRRP